MTTESFRWRIVNFLNRKPRTCITSLVEWAMTDDKQERKEIHPLSNAFRVQGCQDDMKEVGSCYCGRYRDQPRIEAEQAEWDVKYPPMSADPWAETETTQEAS